MFELETVLYTGRTHTTGGREGSARSSDGRLDVKLSPPGPTGSGSNPEQLLAAGWSACFISAIHHEAERLGVSLPGTVAIDAAIDLGTIGGMNMLAAHFKIFLPGLDRAIAEQLVTAAHRICPYSRATRGNIHVDIKIA